MDSLQRTCDSCRWFVEIPYIFKAERFFESSPGRWSLTKRPAPYKMLARKKPGNELSIHGQIRQKQSTKYQANYIHCCPANLKVQKAAQATLTRHCILRLWQMNSHGPTKNHKIHIFEILIFSMTLAGQKQITLSQ